MTDFNVMQIGSVINKEMNGVKLYVYFFGFRREIRSTLKCASTRYTLSGPKSHLLKIAKLFKFK